MPFDDMLEAILAEAEKADSMDAVLDGWMDKLDETFIPSLGNLINVATPEELPPLQRLMDAMQEREDTQALRRGTDEEIDDIMKQLSEISYQSQDTADYDQ